MGQPMDLPDVAKNAASLLKALDLNGNGFVQKSELKCICALLWDGELPKDRDTFEKEFEERFTTWDADHSGNVDIKQIDSLQQVAPPSGGAKDKTVTTSANKKGMDLHNVPKSCIEWIQELA